MSSLPALVTLYHGCRFRSRLEARWAVFLDSLQVRWEYEAEGFRLPSGQPYLPDFRLPDLDYWLEIKPYSHADPLGHPLISGYEPEDVGYDLASRFYLLCGQPRMDPQTHFLHVDDSAGYQGYHLADRDYYWCECPGCGRLGLSWEARVDRLPCGCATTQGHWSRPCSERLEWAYTAASRADFSNGQAV